MDGAESRTHLDGRSVLEAALAEIVGPTVRVGARRIDTADIVELFPQERQVVALATPSRVREFATGRALLRELLGERLVIPTAPDRRPVLPSGVVASLAHEQTYAVAAVTRDPTIVSLGIDIEPDDPLPEEIHSVVLRNDERGLDARLAFVLKEATYKAWSAVGGRMLDHHEVHLTVSGDAFESEIVPSRDHFCGRFSLVEHRWIAVVVHPAK